MKNPDTMSFPEMMGYILAEETTCRQYLQALIDKGCKIKAPMEKLTHAQCIDVVLEIINDIQRRDRIIIR